MIASIQGMLHNKYAKLQGRFVQLLRNKIISGVMTSDGDLLLAPQGNATRAQAAALLMNFLRASGSVLTVSIDQPESTVTDIHQGLTGTFLTDEGVPVDTITYTVSNAEQEEENYASGQVMLDETAGTWKLNDVQLLPGRNVITVTVADSQEKTAEAQVALTYDSGTLKEYSESEVTYTNEEQTGEGCCPVSATKKDASHDASFSVS